MKSTLFWLHHFDVSAKQSRIDWSLRPNINIAEKRAIIPSLKAWQLGETSEGKQLLAITTKYAHQNNDPDLIPVMELFIKEEQKHGNNLGLYIELIGEKRLKKNWGDSLFRKARHFNENMAIWTITVITVEHAAQIYYKAIKDATNCPLLKAICTDILIDEASHVDFQRERFIRIYQTKSSIYQWFVDVFFKTFYYGTSVVIWLEHRQALGAGGIDFESFMKKMYWKFERIYSVMEKEKKAVKSWLIPSEA